MKGPIAWSVVAAGALLGPLASMAMADEHSGAAGGFVNELDEPTSHVSVGSDEGSDPDGPGDGGATRAGASSGGSGGESTGRTCRYVPLINDGEGEPVPVASSSYTEDGEEVEGPSAYWATRVCDNPDGTQGIGLVTVPTGDPAAPAETVDVEALAQEALESVSIPDPGIGTAPPRDRLHVQVPTWLWIDGTWWRTYEATATAGPVSATAVARPAAVTWSMGDGSTVVCQGPGTAWAPGADEAATGCSHTYRSASEGSYQVTATVELTVSWSATTGESGTLPTISRSSAVPVEVEEIQALETR